MSEVAVPEVVHLSDGGTSVVLDLRSWTEPRISYWGPQLTGSSLETLVEICRAGDPPAVSAGLSVTPQLSLLSLPSAGWTGTPSLEGHRGGREFSLCFELQSAECESDATVLRLLDNEAQIAVEIELRVLDNGLFSQRLTLENLGSEDYTLQSAMLAFPIPDDCEELLDLTGRHLLERVPQRHALTYGTYLRESRHGRAGADAAVLLVAGRPGFGFERGLVYGTHVAWSGNYRLLAERLIAGGESFLAGGELLLAGELVLGSGESYASPVVFGSWGDGLSELSHRFHAALRAEHHPSRRPGAGIRYPITLNTWEAVYFNQSLERLSALADRAAEVGVERFVLDDGWFRGRHDDTKGLGDWYVDAEVWPDGLSALCEHVTALGMQFGLWVEPEMINPDSDLARAHPDWIVRARTELPVAGRHQQLLNIANPDAWTYILERLSALIDEYPISYLKWDHNRDLVESGGGPGSGATVHEQTLAFYRLLDTLRERYPKLEIEDCASGAFRLDYGILSRTDRIWGSDSLDPLDRLQIQRYSELLVPPEMIGSHVGAERVHASGRTVSLELRASVALLASFGIEWDLTKLDADELEQVKWWVALAKRVRDRIADALTINVDVPGPGLDVRGLVSSDRTWALFTIISTDTAPARPAPRLRLPGLTSEGRYRVQVVLDNAKGGLSELAWVQRQIVVTGLELSTIGLRPPVQLPGEVLIVELEAVK